jgi:hypothetical protein
MPGMEGGEFTLGLTVAAGLLAAWLDTRLGDARPETPMQRMAHAGLSIVGLMAAVGLLYLAHGLPDAAFMAAVLAVFLPALVYALLAGVWMLRTLVDLAGFARR